jgi:hypothetical protein
VWFLVLILARAGFVSLLCAEGSSTRFVFAPVSVRLGPYPASTKQALGLPIARRRLRLVFSSRVVRRSFLVFGLACDAPPGTPISRVAVPR